MSKVYRRSAKPAIILSAPLWRSHVHPDVVGMTGGAHWAVGLRIGNLSGSDFVTVAVRLQPTERTPRNYYAHCAHEPCDKVVKNSQFSQDVLKQHVTIFELERFMERKSLQALASRSDA
jgi:hypothetical protein